MKDRCAFCDARLDGKTVAFDAERSRTWTVCGRCGQWNLAELNVAELEQQFIATSRRAVHGDVGVARLEGGRRIIRVGAGGWWSFAAWRHARRIRRRRIGSVFFIGVPFVVTKPLSLAISLVGLGVLGAVAFWMWFFERVCRVPLSAGGFAWIRGRHEGKARLRIRGESFELLVRHDAGESVLRGQEALPVLAVLLARRNHMGGSGPEVEAAIEAIERAGGASEVFMRLKPELVHVDSEGILLEWISKPLRLALEMAAHEEVERRVSGAEVAAIRYEARDAQERARIVEELA